MFASDEYELLDFGDGRKLERFGPYVLDRPSPAAEAIARRSVQLWASRSARYQRDGTTGGWSCEKAIEPWRLDFGSIVLELKLSPSGQLGVFPEQAANWRWIAGQVHRAGRPKVLNLFAYTGASTLAAAAAGAEVVHVDAAAGVVDWARRNAQASGMDHLPLRWIVEDVLKFVRRERMRGNYYDAVILDPPAYGHGPRGQSWKLENQLGELLSLCLELCGGRPQFLLLSCHSGSLGRASELLDYTIARHPRLRDEGDLSGSELCLVSSAGEHLHCGAAIRWSRGRA